MVLSTHRCWSGIRAYVWGSAVTMSHPPPPTSTRKYHAPTPPVSVNSTTVRPAASRDPARRSAAQNSSGGNAIAITHAEITSARSRSSPVVVNSAPVKLAKKW